MKFIKITLILFSLLLNSYCGQPEDHENLDADARIVGFVADKCYCCRGWIIEIGDQTIKADSIPGLNLSDTLLFPINAVITTGTKTRDCSEYIINMKPTPDYYEINSCMVIR